MDMGHVRCVSPKLPTTRKYEKPIELSKLMLGKKEETKKPRR